MHASCESPWSLSAKHHVLGACFSLMAPFRPRFSRDEMAHSAHVQRLRRCLYTFWYPYIPTCRFHGTACPCTSRPLSGGTTKSGHLCGSGASARCACCTSLPGCPMPCVGACAGACTLSHSDARSTCALTLAKSIPRKVTMTSWPCRVALSVMLTGIYGARGRSRWGSPLAP
jgi:hypothetical protein